MGASQFWRAENKATNLRIEGTAGGPHRLTGHKLGEGSHLDFDDEDLNAIIEYAVALGRCYRKKAARRRKKPTEAVQPGRAVA